MLKSPPANLMPPAAAPRRAFSLVEVLVVVAIVGVLTAIVVPATSALQGAANATDELAIARRTTQAWRNWSFDHEGRLLPGQIEMSADLPPDEAPVQINGTAVPEIARRRWLWRLHSYLDDPVQTLWGGAQAQWREQVMDGSGDPATKLYVATLHPTLGLNAEWIGGRQSGESDTWSLTQFGQSLDPLATPLFAESMAQLRRPSDLVLFASARGNDNASGGQVIEGWWRIEPPWRPGATGGQMSWATTDSGGFQVPDQGTDPADSGFVSARHDGRTTVAAPDGSVRVESFDRLGDMRRWANDATTSNWSPALPGS